MKTKVLYIPDQKSASFDQKIVNFFRNICDWDVQIFDEPFSNINVVRVNEIQDKFEMVIGVGSGALLAEFVEGDCSKILIDPLRFTDWIWENKSLLNEINHLQEKFSNIDRECEKIYRYFTPYNNYKKDIDMTGHYIISETRPTVRINEGGVVFDGRWFEETLLVIMENLNYHLRPEGKMN